MKACKHCGIEKPPSGFQPNSRCKDGRIGKCKICIAEWAGLVREHMWTDEDRAKRAAYQEAYRVANRTKELAYRAAYREANRETIRVNQVAYRKANPEKEKARVAADYARKKIEKCQLQPGQA